MIKMFLVYIQILSIVFSGYCFSATDRVDDQKYGVENVLINGGGETGKIGWACVNATVGTSQTAANITDGKNGLVFTATNTNGYCYTSFTTKKSRYDNEAFMYYKTTASDVILDVYQSTSSQNPKILSAQTSMKESTHATFTGENTAFTLRITMPTNGTVVYADEIYAGKYKNIGTVQQPRFLGSIEWAPTANCAIENSTASTDPGDYTANPYCDDNTITYKGNAVPDASNPGQLPQLRLLNVPTSGHLVINAYGMFEVYRNSSTNAYGYYRFSDGTNTTTKVTVDFGVFASANHNLSIPQISGSFDLTSGGDKTYKLQCKGATGCNIYAIGSGLKIEAIWYPSSSETVYGNPPIDSTGMIVPSASATCPNGTFLADGSAKSRTTYAKLFNKISTTWGVGDGTTTFNIPNLINRFLRGAGAATDGNGGDTVNLGAFQDTSNLAHSHDVGSANYWASFVAAYGTASTLGVGSSGYHSGEYLTAKSSGGNESRPKSYGVNYCIVYDGNVFMPQIVNSVTHSKANQQRIVRGTLSQCNSSGSGITYAGTGDWSVANGGGTGLCTITFSPAFADNDISCSAMAANIIYEGNAPTASSWSLVWGHAQSGAAAAPGASQFICIGNK